MLAEVSAPTISRFEKGEKDIQLSSVLRILGMLDLVDQRNLIFSELKPGYDSSRMIVIFWGQDVDKKVRCEISMEALEDHYKSNSKDPIKIFIENHSAIEQEARRKYLANRLEEGGSILIKTNDLLYGNFGVKS